MTKEFYNKKYSDEDNVKKYTNVDMLRHMADIAEEAGNEELADIHNINADDTENVLNILDDFLKMDL